MRLIETSIMTIISLVLPFFLVDSLILKNQNWEKYSILKKNIASNKKQLPSIVR